jgi:uncharacterized membrane protein YgdD (TMEM256/DUF423 family)
MSTLFISIAGILGFLGVALGAFGAHALRKRFAENPHLEANYKTAVLYHLVHVPVLLFLGVVAMQDMIIPGFGREGLIMDPNFLALAGWLFVIGIVLFSGSLYLMALTGNRKLGMITPLGGLAFLAGWILLILLPRYWTVFPIPF